MKNRLTYKNYIEEYEVNFEKNSEKQWSIAESDTHIKVTGEPIDKLAGFENFMEKWGFESLVDIEDMMHTFTLYRNESGDYYKEAEKEKQALKDRWQKLKEFVIEKGGNYFKKELFFEVEDDYKKVLFKMEELEKE